jgi:uncharacterized protein
MAAPGEYPAGSATIVHDANPRPIHPDQLWHAHGLGAGLLDLNNTHAQALSWLEPQQLTHMVRNAFLAQAIGRAEAFLLAFDQGADYDSPNFLWFRSRYPRFVYIDRIVVAEAARGRGLARRLYASLFEQAAAAGHHCVVCEVNAEPANPVSDAFHQTMGFVKVGSGVIHQGAKTVTYLSRAVGISPTTSPP